MALFLPELGTARGRADTKSSRLKEEERTA